MLIGVWLVVLMMVSGVLLNVIWLCSRLLFCVMLWVGLNSVVVRVF